MKWIRHQEIPWQKAIISVVCQTQKLGELHGIIYTNIFKNCEDFLTPDNISYSPDLTALMHYVISLHYRLFILREFASPTALVQDGQSSRRH